MIKICQKCQTTFTTGERRRKFCSVKCSDTSRYNTPESFWAKVDIKGPEECWPWKASFQPSGYGQITYRGRIHNSHRLAYTLTHGAIPDGLSILHSCSNRFCCNPQHLRPGTQLENANDMVKAGHHTLGERNAQSKLTKEQVLEIRSLYTTTKLSQREIGLKFGISPGGVSHVLRDRWLHL